MKKSVETTEGGTTPLNGKPATISDMNFVPSNDFPQERFQEFGKIRERIVSAALERGSCHRSPTKAAAVCEVMASGSLSLSNSLRSQRRVQIPVCCRQSAFP